VGAAIVVIRRQPPWAVRDGRGRIRGPACQGQEDVVERRLAAVDVARGDAGAVERADDLEQRRPGRHRHREHAPVQVAGGRAVGERGEGGLAGGQVLGCGDRDVDALAAHARLELRRRSGSCDAAAVKQDDLVGEPVGFVEVLSRQ
jgi:hypothetical protein